MRPEIADDAGDAAGVAERSADMVPLRSADVVMRLARLGSFHQTRLSFMRALLRRLHREGWRFDRPVWRLDARGEGAAVYRARGPERSYSLVCFVHDLDPAKRTDRVIADEWDATFALFDGEPSEADIVRLSMNVPKQEAGRCSDREIVLLRANKSVRLFDYVAGCLAAGRQPATCEIDKVGYLMRTTAVYGSGKFGLADRQAIAGRPELAGPFRAEMLSVWLTRAFTIDLVEHAARARAPGAAVQLSAALRRRFGVGNATGLGMAPFLINHPTLIHRWILARETGLARVRAVGWAAPEHQRVFADRLLRAQCYAASWRVEDPIQSRRIAGLARDLARLSAHVAAGALDRVSPWDGLYRWAEGALTVEGQELLVTLMLEPYGELVDDLVDAMATDESTSFRIDGAMRIGMLRDLIARDYAWALAIDFRDPAACARFWYVSEEKLEPRLGERFEEPGAERELPLAAGRAVAALDAALASRRPDETVAAFLIEAPEHRHAVRRVQITDRHPYAEIRDNLIDAAVRPIDMLRCKLSFFGASRFDPKSDRWVRITMYQYAPYPDELATADPDDWAFPSLT